MNVFLEKKNKPTLKEALGKVTAVAAFATLVSACTPPDPGNGGGPTAADIVDLTVDATSYTDTVYVNLATGAVLDLTDEQAADSSEWHIGLQRFDIVTNGGVSGPGAVQGALVSTPDGFYDQNGDVIASAFINADAEDQVDPVLADLPDVLSFVQDRANSAIKTPAGVPIPSTDNLDYGWYTYNTITHQLAANTDNVWQIRSAEGVSYAQMRANTVSLVPVDPSQGIFGYSVVLDFAVAPNGTDAFVADAASFNVNALTGGDVCFDWDSNANVDCSGNVWDVMLRVADRSVALYTNSGATGSGGAGAFGPISPTLAQVFYISGTQDATGGPIVAQQYAADKNYSVFNSPDNSIESAIFEYGVDPSPQYAHVLFPTFRVFLIDVDAGDEEAARFKVQITDYYDDASVSGHVALRILEVE